MVHLLHNERQDPARRQAEARLWHASSGVLARAVRQRLLGVSRSAGASTAARRAMLWPRSGGPPLCFANRALNSEAIYRVIGTAGDLVEVETLRVPGVPTETRMWFTAAAVGRMKLLENREWARR